MTEKNNMIKKETLIYALLIGFVAGFVAGAIFAVYKLTPSTPHDHATQTETQQPTQQQAASAEQLKQQTSEAISNMEAEVTANPDSGAAWTQLGHLYYDTEQTEKAIKAYTRSLEIQPDNSDVWTDLGVMYRRNKQPEKAIESFEKAYSINPQHAPSRLNKGIVLHYDFNKPKEAIAVWEELLVINPEAKLNNGMPMRQAIEEIKKEIQATPPQE